MVTRCGEKRFVLIQFLWNDPRETHVVIETIERKLNHFRVLIEPLSLHIALGIVPFLHRTKECFRVVQFVERVGEQVHPFGFEFEHGGKKLNRLVREGALEVRRRRYGHVWRLWHGIRLWHDLRIRLERV